MRPVVFLLLLSGCAPVEAASPLPELATTSDQSVSDSAPDTAYVSVSATPEPPPRSCREWLAKSQIGFEDAAPRGTIVDAVKLWPVINGITFRHHDNPEPTKLWVDCRFAQRLFAATDLLRARGVRQVIHVGTYEPKCVGGGTPESRPGCTLSTHALGMAIDVVAFVRDNDVVEIARDFVKRDGPWPTCLAPRGDERDAFLKELVCALDGTFSVLLTPNWDWQHRGHFHLALRPPSKTPWSNGVDPVRGGD